MKVLCLPYTHTLSHLSRPLAVAFELAQRGYDVIFAGESSKTRFIESAGFTVMPLYEPNPEDLFGNIRAGKLRFVSDKEIERMIDADVALFRAIKPDIVLTDGRFSAPISTHIFNVKHAAIVNVSSTEYRALPYIPFFEGLPFWLCNRQSLSWKTLQSINLSVEMLVFDNVMNVFKKLSRKYGLQYITTATNCLTGKDLTLLADIPEYFPTRKLPGNYHYVGPLTWKTNLQLPDWWPPSTNNFPLIYITMGTTGIGDFFNKVYDLCKVSDFSAIITTGAQTDELRTLDGKIYTEKFIDGDKAMEVCDLVVCHGGNGTIYQALQHGKPIIGIPTIPDQMFNMRRVEALKVGKTLSWDEFARNPAMLTETIKSIVEDQSFYKNAEIYKTILSTYNAPNNAADWIEGLSNLS